MVAWTRVAALRRERCLGDDVEVEPLRSLMGWDGRDLVIPGGT